MTDDELIAEARRLGEPTSGDGWRRLLWQMADRLALARARLSRMGVEDVDASAPDERPGDSDRDGRCHYCGKVVPRPTVLRICKACEAMIYPDEPPYASDMVD